MKSRIRKRIRRAVSVIITAAMVLSLMPYMPSGILDAKADTTSSITEETVLNLNINEGVFTSTNETIQSTTKTVGNFILDATSGKFQEKTGYGACINSGTKITFDVDGPCKVTIVDSYSNGGAISLYKSGSDDAVDSVEGSKSTLTLNYSGTEAATLSIVIESAQNYFSTVTVTPVEATVAKYAIVSGTIDSAVNGATLSFKASGASAVTTTVANGAYSVELPIGVSYAVSISGDAADGYEVNEGETVDLTSATEGQSITNNITLNQWTPNKAFSLTIGDSTFSVTSGETEDDDFTVEKTSGNGFVELANSTTAIVWADLQGGGSGTLTSSLVTNVSNNVTAAISGNTITVTYSDSTGKPTGYTLIVKDNSATGTPSANGTPISYDFKDGSVVSKLYVKGSSYVLKNGAKVSSTDKLITIVANKSICYNDASHGILISSGDAVEVKVAGNATVTFEMCQYTNGQKTGSLMTPTGMAEGGSITPESSDFHPSTEGGTVTFTYTGDATTLTFTYTGSGSGYIHSMSVTNEAPATSENTQEVMPSVPTTFGTAGNLAVVPTGQRLVMTQTGGLMQTTSGAIDSSVSYYVFPQTTDWETLTADVVLNTCGASNNNGVFVGAFDGTNMATLAIRNKTGLRGIYSKSSTDMAGAGGTNIAIADGERVTFTVHKTTDAFEVAYETESGVTGNTTFKYNSSSYLLFKDKGSSSSLYYGFAFAGSTTTITNMKLTKSDGTVVYDQNKCYAPLGKAPVVSSVTAEADSSREFITVNLTGENCDGDGKYVIQVSKDGINYTDIVTDLTDKTFKYVLEDTGTATYYFRACGTLGNSAEQIQNNRNSYVTIATPVTVIGALTAPTVTVTSNELMASLSWTATDTANKYEVYRYSYDDTESNPTKIATVTTTSYVDTNVTAEMPYYYYVKAYSATNNSNNSEVVWTVPSAGHTGTYAYEDEAAKLTITKRSYNTVFDSNVVIEGVASNAGTVVAEVNGVPQGSQTVAERGKFSFNLTVAEGRNDVNLYFTDGDGVKTRKTFNYVYLTSYDKVVDGSYTGTDGSDVNGIPTYSTVQAAVDSVSSSNTERVTILVREGSYNERLDVTRPYITLIGEDSEKVNINYFDAQYLGGDMAKRCATYIEKTAVEFSAENLTFENNYEYGSIVQSNMSADALRTDAENVSFVNVNFLGYQDTLCANAGTQYYYKCNVYGTIDFIYGNEPRAYFNDCQMIFRYYADKNSGYVLAPKTSASAEYGIIFNNCQILSEDGCSGSGYYLARPWGADAYVTFINTYMGSIINKNAPYSDMSGNLATAARFFEYYSYGPGYIINSARRQISVTKAESMLSTSKLGWNPENVVSQISANDYIGNVVTTTEAKYVYATYSEDTYSQSEGNDKGLAQYSMEGYASADGVTGGGLLYETSSNYYTVDTAEEFLDALVSSKSSGAKSVIELTADIGLGSNEISDFDSYSSVIKAYTAQALTHPTLIKSGVSVLTLKGMSNLTIYSKNGSKVLHANFDISGSSNIIIRNLVFDELWEWDDDTSGAYDRNDWDYMTIEKESTDIWIDHCTFYKAYDGVVDIKTPAANGTSNVTISWCSFLPGSSGTFWEDMMKVMEANPSKYTYYSECLSEGMTAQQIRNYAYGQKKTHLLGQSDDDSTADGIRLTLANNYYKNSMDRMPRLRYGNAHVYNCILDAQDIYNYKEDITKTCGETVGAKIVSNGASSTCGAQLLLENCYLSGIINALNSGNGSSPSGYINAINSAYYMGGVATILEPKSNSTTDSRVLVLNASEFKADLPYSSYILYDANSLSTNVQPYTGAGVLNLTTLQWEKTKYNDTYTGGGNSGNNENDSGSGNEDSDDDSDSTSNNITTGTTNNTANGSTIQITGEPSWIAVADVITAATNGEIVTVQMTTTTDLPVNVLQKIAGKDVTVVLAVKDDIKWIINGKDLVGTDFHALNVGVEKNTDNIPQDLIDSVKGNNESVEISLDYDGEFGFTMTLSINLEQKNAGKYANLYYYNVEAGQLEFMASSIVAADGYAGLPFSHASDYVIVLSDEDMANAVNTSVTGDGASASTGDKAPITVLLFMLGGSLAYLAAPKNKRKKQNEM